MPEILKVDDLLLKGLLVAEAGTGKTSLVASAADCPEMSPVCFLDFEGGTLSVAHRSGLYRERIRSTAQLERVHEQIVNKKDVHADIRTYIIDSGSEFGELCLEEVARDAYVAAQGSDRLAHRESVDDVQLKDYGKATKRVRRLFRWFRDLEDKNVLITALPQFRYPPEPANLSESEKRKREEAIKLGLIKPVEIVPSFTQKLGNAIVGFVDFAWYIHRAERKLEGGQIELVRQLVTRPAGPLKFLKTRGPHFADALGAGKEIQMVKGVPCIEGVPAMKYLYDLFSRTVRSAV